MARMPPGRVLEIGSRARSGTVYRGIVPSHLAYTGLDILEGPNVDVVGDAHELERSVGFGQFNVVYSIAVFEHLAMPWKAALSINRVLAHGGILYAGTHQTFPVHERPWDFWRFSDRAWHSLFNSATGFEVLGTAMGEPADIVPRASKAAVWGIDNQPAFLTCGVLARKVGQPRVGWPVSIADLDDAGFDPY
jgi:SAM-dependent methyltransferase